MSTYEAWFDGACWPNPNGHAACGALIKLNGETIFEDSAYLGNENTSNNFAEYHGLRLILLYLIENKIENCAIFGDSDLVIKQITGEWKAGKLSKKEARGKVPIKPRYYMPAYEACRELANQLTGISFKWIPRDQNEEADALSTKPLRDRGLREEYRHDPLANRMRELDEAFEHAIR